MMNLIWLISVHLAWAQTPSSYDQFLHAVRERNLTLRVSEASARAARSGADGYFLEAPMVSYIRVSDPSGSANGFEISQKLPFPSKITSDRKVRAAAADVALNQNRATETEVLTQARKIYFDLWAAQQKLRALLEKRKFLEEHIRLARAGVRSNSFLRVHQLKSENDLDLLETEIMNSEQEIREREIALQEYLNLEIKPTSIQLDEPPSIALNSPSDSSYALEVSLKTLQMAEAQKDKADSEWSPDLIIRYRDVAATSMSPRLTEFGLGLTLPFIFPWDRSATSETSSHLQQQARFGLEKEKRRIESQKQLLFQRANSLKKQIDIIYNRLLPRAEKRMRLVHNIAPRDMETLVDHRETMEAIPDLKIRALQMRTDQEFTLAELMKLEGKK